MFIFIGFRSRSKASSRPTPPPCRVLSLLNIFLLGFSMMQQSGTVSSKWVSVKQIMLYLFVKAD